ncbi:hypothetical protein M422DRAFT_170886 [Sphaerobolus stellatus SS14]|uniref:Uncharacterized protein n=1 Tax=Sphaerobolus stellatus (strain SS14) TaxID=990650 RepID=A0A0C9UHV3_SPHS4|nr:hypothetical protein M422DRAFT_170886 [Sphaerobolus stellatus SS14]
MWSIVDEDAPVVANAFYSRLLGKGKYSVRKDGSLQVAYVLYEAVQELREKVGKMNFVKWVLFIHFGS